MSLEESCVEPKLTFAFGPVKTNWPGRSQAGSADVAALLPHSDRGYNPLHLEGKTLAEPMSRAHIHQRAWLSIALLFCGLPHQVLGQTTPATPALPDVAETHLAKGYDALQRERYDIAESEFRAALAVDPSLVLRAQFPLGVSLFEQHKSAEARREFESVRREAGDHPNVLYYLGRLDIESRDFSAAVNCLSQAVAKPPFPDTAYYLGFAYFKEGDLNNAEKWLKQASQANPGDPRIPYQLGLVYRKQGREEEAKKSLDLSEEMHRKDDAEIQLRTECAQKLGTGPRDEARSLCDKLYDPDNPDRLTELGAIYGQHGDLEAALKPFLRAAELSPQSPQVQFNLALTYFQLNRFEDARAPLEQALKRWPDLFPLNALYGAVLAKLGELDRAYDVLQHAHQLNPQDSSNTNFLYATTVKLGEKQQAARQYPAALRYFGEAARLRPEDPAPHRSMAEIYTHMGKPAQATEERQEADRLGNK
jgi:tetratricopeptide (TPR) repeat protein